MFIGTNNPTRLCISIQLEQTGAGLYIYEQVYPIPKPPYTIRVILSIDLPGYERSSLQAVCV
jgi:hypothetical protein